MKKGDQRLPTAEEKIAFKEEMEEMPVLRAMVGLVHDALVIKPKGRKGWRDFERDCVKTPAEKEALPVVRGLVIGAKEPVVKIGLNRLISLARGGLGYRDLISACAKSPDSNPALELLKSRITEEARFR